MKHRLFLLIALIIGSVGIVGAQDAPRVLATTTILADVAQNVAGDLLTVDTLVPRAADAHAYEPSPADVARVEAADLLLVVGVGYEAFLGDLLENVGSESAQVVTVSNGIEMLAFSEGEHEGDAAEYLGVLGEIECEAHDEEAEAEPEEEHEHGACDPHVWTDPLNAIVWTNNIADALSAADPANAAAYRANADAYIVQLETVSDEVIETLAVIPQESRILVTNHEFMGYFAAAYGFEVVGTVLPGLTTDAEPNPQELAALIELVETEGVPAIFAEVSSNPQLAEVVAQEAGIDVVTNLYSEALSEADGPASTYLDYLRYNASVIVDGLSE